MANSTTVFERTLLKSRRLFLWDDVDADSAKNLIQQIKCLWRKDNTKPIYLYIHSNGGDIFAQAAIVDEIQNITALQGEFYTICNGNACSSAANILAMGTPGYRYATPHSCIMMHSASCSMGDTKLHEQKGWIEYIHKHQIEITNLIGKACGKSGPAKLKKFNDDLKNAVFFNTKEAIKYGVIDDVWTPQLEEKVNQDERDAEAAEKSE